MSNGYVHSTITGLTAVGLGVASVMAGRPGWALPIAGGALLGLVLTPDLDVDAGCISHAIVRRLLGPLWWLWYFYWWPYAKIMPHRGPSHWPVVGTVSRLLYALPLWLPVVWGLSPELFTLWLLAFGLAVADFNHFLLDMLDKATGGKL